MAKNLAKDETKVTKKEGSKKSGVPKRFRITCPPSIFELKNRLILETFRTIFEQFPRKIDELREMIYVKDQFPPFRTDVTTSTDIFGIPPSLNSIRETQEKNEEKRRKKNKKKKDNSDHGDDEPSECIEVECCNYNRDAQVYLSYDGYIKVNPHFFRLLNVLESYSDFYHIWSTQFLNIVQLLKPQIQDEDNLQSEMHEAVIDMVRDIRDRIKGFDDSESVCTNRLSHIYAIQKHPHIMDYRHQLTLFERQTWFDLCLMLRSLYAFYAETYDFFAKNCDKLLLNTS